MRRRSDRATRAVPRTWFANASLRRIAARSRLGSRASCALTPLTKIDNSPTPETCWPRFPANRFEVRSVTGASYTLIEESEGEGTSGQVRRRYRTAYAGLPVIANDDGSFTIVDTDTRLVRVSAR